MLSSVNRVDIKFITALLANKYVLTFVIFMIWMSFFDKHNLIALRELQSTIDNLQEEKEYFDAELTKLDAKMHSIAVDRERYARETFFLHKENEVVYLVR